MFLYYTDNFESLILKYTYLNESSSVNRFEKNKLGNNDSENCLIVLKSLDSKPNIVLFWQRIIVELKKILSIPFFKLIFIMLFIFSLTFSFRSRLCCLSDIYCRVFRL